MCTTFEKFEFDDGSVVTEQVCEAYTCKYCDAKAAACNFVGEMCLQVYARHVGLCGAYVESEQYSGYISQCASCKHFDGSCCQQ